MRRRKAEKVEGRRHEVDERRRAAQAQTGWNHARSPDEEGNPKHFIVERAVEQTPVFVEGLAVIDYAENAQARPEAAGRCPTGAIAWVEGMQFRNVLPPADGGRVEPARGSEIQ